MAALLRPFDTLGAILVSSSIFAASQSRPGLLIPVFISGVLLSWLYVKMGSIWPPFAAHFAQNMIPLSTKTVFR